MASFEDITGWREELERFRATDEGAHLFELSVRDDKTGLLVSRSPPALSFPVVLYLSDLFLQHSELLEAVRILVAWDQILADNPELEDDPEKAQAHPARPTSARKTVNAFRDWYAMKLGQPYNQSALNLASSIAIKVVNGDLPAVRSRETSNWAGDRFHRVLKNTENWGASSDRYRRIFSMFYRFLRT